MITFAVGDAVMWKGKKETLTGRVVAIVPEGGDPLRYVPRGYSLRTSSPVLARPHKSYIVKGANGVCVWPPVPSLTPMPDVARKETV